MPVGDLTEEEIYELEHGDKLEINQNAWDNIMSLLTNYEEVGEVHANFSTTKNTTPGKDIRPAAVFWLHSPEMIKLLLRDLERLVEFVQEVDRITRIEPYRGAEHNDRAVIRQKLKKLLPETFDLKVEPGTVMERIEEIQNNRG